MSNVSTSEPLRSTQLIALARDLDPSITERTLEHWRHLGLLPHAMRSGQDGKRPIWTYPAATADQLSALLHLRKLTKDPNALRATLWYNGYSIDTGRVRESISAFLGGLLATLEKELAKNNPRVGSDPDMRWQAIQALAATQARKRGKGVPRFGRQALRERTTAFASMFGLVLDDPTALKRLELDASTVERLIGVDKARRFRPEGAGPWLDGAPEDGLVAFSQTGGLSRLIAVTEGASEAELEAARDVARLLLGGLTAFARLADAMSGRENTSGLAGLRMLVDEPLSAIVIVPLILSLLASPQIAQNLHGVLEAIGTSIVPVEQRVKALAELSEEERALELENLSNLPFAQQLQINRLIRSSS